jgi:hypothetical protein
MRRTLVVGVVLLAGLVLTAPVGAAAPTPAEKKLQTQVAALQKQSKTLQKQVKTLQTQLKALQGIVGGALALNVCSTSLAADALQGTWAAINAREALTGQVPVFPTESAVNDVNACQDLKVTRQPTASPPNLTPFKALLSIFQSFG